MLLTYEIDAMTQEQRIQLRDALLNSRAPISYAYLNTAIDKAV